jgi:very-short-patch-repair endonuclease
LLRRPAWKRFLASAKCNARTPSRAEHFAALAAQARLAGKRRRLLDRWNQQMTPLGAPAPEQLGAQPENTARQFKAQIERCLQWHDQQYAPFVAMVSQAGLDFESLLAGEPPWLEEDGELRRIEQCLCGRLRMSLEARRNAARRMQLNETVAGRRQAMEQLLAADHQAPVVVQLRNALRDHDPEAYRHAFQRLTELHRRLEALHRRRSLLARLRPFAPGWAQAIQERTGLYGHNHPPARIAEAWLWRQIKDELDRRSSVSIPDLQERLHAVKNKLEKVTQSLIENKAWAAQIQRSRRNPNLQAALTGWLQTMRAIGAGHGIRVPRLRAEAERLMMTCREAVPVWIMPLSRVVENFNPAVTRFDVVIIDEASQCDVMALLALYMGKEVIVVGDHEQVSPAAVGQELDPVDQLINEHLRPSIPNAHLYDPKRSIYDLAQMFFGETIRLLEHFRCVPQIIQFSNHLSYQGEIKPLREPGKDGLRPFVVARRVNDRYEQSRKINEVEAREIVSLILACSEQPAYSGKTFGVVSLVGEQQAYWIDSLLRRHMEAEKFEKVHRILCGNAAQFQGDERDVVFLSVVDSSDGGVLPLRQTDEFKRRFNVAASRARDQMWVIHSLDPGAHLQPGDLRRRLIEYAENPDALEAAINQAGAAAESPFEKDVAGRLIQAGYRIVPQWRAGSYRIDIVVQGLSDRLAIECDGDRFHPIERIPDDLARQAVLERLGWKFERIRGSEFYRDPDSAMQRVFRRLAELNIEPLGHAADADDNPEPELYQRVLRRAQEIRRELFEAPDEAGTEEEFFFQPIGQ